MGRYVTGDFDYKFWFATQSSTDIEEFGGYEDTNIHWGWSSDDLPDITNHIRELKFAFKKAHGLTYKEFIKILDDKGYISGSNDKETQTDIWATKCKDASLIDLGEHIRNAVKKLDSVYVTAEC